MADSTRVRILARIRAIRAKASDKASTQEEALSLIEFSARLMEQHEISEAELGEVSGENSPKFQVWGAPLKIKDNEAYMMFCGMLGEMFGCFVAFSHKKDEMVISAKRSSIEAFSEVLGFVTEQIIREYEQTPLLFRNGDLLNGMIYGVCSKIDQQRKSLLTSRLPVLHNEAEKHLEEYMGDKLISQEMEKPAWNSMMAVGMMVGERIDINRKVKD